MGWSVRGGEKREAADSKGARRIVLSFAFQAEEAGEFGFDGFGGDAAADTAADDLEFAGGAIGFGVDVANDLRARENGQRVVAAHAFRGRRVNFPRVIEIPDRLRDAAVVDQRIEGGEEEGTFDFRFSIPDFRFSVFDFSGSFAGGEERGVFAEAVERGAAIDDDGLDEVGDLAEFVAFQEGEAALTEFERGEPARGVGGGRRGLRENPGGENAFGKIVNAALVDAVRDEDASVEEEFLQRGFRERGGAPHAAAAAIVSDVVGGERTALRDFFEDVCGELFLARCESAGPRAGDACALFHRGEEVRPRFEREGDERVVAGEMVLERGALRGRERRIGAAVEMAHEIALAVTGDAVAQDEIVHASADVDRIDLHETVMRERGGDVGRRLIEQETGAGETARGEGRNVERRRHEWRQSSARAACVNKKTRRLG